MKTQEFVALKTKSNKPFFGLERQWLATIPEGYKKINLEQCTLISKELIEYGLEWSRKWPLKSLYLFGEPGSGKTTFSFAVIKKVIQLSEGEFYFSPKYITGYDLNQNLLQAVKSFGGDAWEIQKLCDSDLLFIDDLDKVSGTDRFKLQLFEIINRRLINNKPTIITSNCKPKALSELIANAAIISRIEDPRKWEMFEFSGDLRKSNVVDF